jgi:hypothetical protein
VGRPQCPIFESAHAAAIESAFVATQGSMRMFIELFILVALVAVVLIALRPPRK